jgi:hypothetical protein
MPRQAKLGKERMNSGTGWRLRLDGRILLTSIDQGLPGTRGRVFYRAVNSLTKYPPVRSVGSLVW